MQNTFSRAFNRTVKRLKGVPLELDDFSQIVTLFEPGHLPVYAERQFGSDFWAIKRCRLSAEPVQPEVLKAGLTTAEAVQNLEARENEYAANVRGFPASKSPYNHFSRVKALLPG